MLWRALDQNYVSSSDGEPNLPQARSHCTLAATDAQLFLFGGAVRFSGKYSLLTVGLRRCFFVSQYSDAVVYPQLKFKICGSSTLKPKRGRNFYNQDHHLRDMLMFRSFLGGTCLFTVAAIVDLWDQVKDHFVFCVGSLTLSHSAHSVDRSTDYFDDFFALDLVQGRWSRISSSNVSGSFPSGRGFHGAALLDGTLWLFGGEGLQAGSSAGWSLIPAGS